MANLMSRRLGSVSFFAFCLLLPVVSIPWKDCLRQKPEWYGGAEAIRIAENLLLYQRAIGGWPKNIDMARPLGPAERAELIAQKGLNEDATIDNGATYTQLIYLARVFNATKQDRFKDGFVRGLDYLLEAQYENGGWPQFYPRAKGYFRHITFNDDAMIGVMTLLREVARDEARYGFVDEARRLRAARAVEKGVECILKCQVRVDGKLTAWCAQHDEVTLAPAPARAYEKISLSGHESVAIVRFLMGVKKPSPEVTASIEAAVAWLEQVKIAGIKIVDRRQARMPNECRRVVVQDAQAPPLWARFYEIGTNRPIFSGRDGTIKYSLAEIECERSDNYQWYVDTPARLLTRDYPAWKRN